MITVQSLVTVEEAHKWLSSQVNIRDMTKARVRSYAEDMKNGKWVQSHPHGLVFDTEGNLIDGQHRLAAQVEANVSLTWTITMGATPDVAEVLDTGQPRQLSTSLYGKDVAGRWKVQIARAIRNYTAGSKSQVMSPSQARNYIDSLDRPGLDVIYQHKKKPRINTPARAAFVYAWPCSDKVRELWQALVQDHPPMNCSGNYQKTFAVLQGVISQRLGGGGSANKDNFLRVLRCIKAIIEDEGLSQAKATEKTEEFFRVKRQS